MTQPVALITGGSRGLGFALARQLLINGWQVIIDSRSSDGKLDQARAQLEQYGNITCLRGDITDPIHLKDLFEIISSLGRLDLVINNASSLGLTPLPFLLDYPLTELEAVFRTNVLAPLELLQAVRPFFKEGVKILNITSDAGVEAYAGWGGYGASKAALEKLSAVLAAENPGFYVYWVDPGEMQTQMKQESAPGEDISDLPLPEEAVPGFIRLIEGNYPSGRYQAQEMA